MHPVVQSIVEALSQGALAGLGKVAGDVVSDSYNSLRRLLLDSYKNVGSIEAGIRGLEERPTSPGAQRRLGEALTECEVWKNREIQQLAQQLRSILEDPMSIVLEMRKAHQRAGLAVIEIVLDRHIETTARARTGPGVDSRDLLTSSDLTASKVSQADIDEIGALHGRIGQIIDSVSNQMVEIKYIESTDLVRKFPLSGHALGQALELIEADKKMHLSHLKLSLTLEYFAQLSRDFTRRIDGERDGVRLASMMLGNALLVYELTSYVINLIENFEIEGIDRIDELYGVARQRVEELKDEQSDLVDCIGAGDVHVEVAEDILSQISERSEAFDIILDEWNCYRSEVVESNEQISAVRASLPTLEVMRRHALIQIGALDVVGLLSLLKGNLKLLNGTIDLVKSVKMTPLTAVRARRMLVS